MQGGTVRNIIACDGIVELHYMLNLRAWSDATYLELLPSPYESLLVSRDTLLLCYEVSDFCDCGEVAFYGDGLAWFKETHEKRVWVRVLFGRQGCAHQLASLL